MYFTVSQSFLFAFARSPAQHLYDFPFFEDDYIRFQIA
jgi:hypothetical protein